MINTSLFLLLKLLCVKISQTLFKYNNIMYYGIKFVIDRGKIFSESVTKNKLSYEKHPITCIKHYRRFIVTDAVLMM